MAQTLKLADDLMGELRAEAELQSRSLAGQAAHWMRIGMAFERSPKVTTESVRSALNLAVDPSMLSEQEWATLKGEFDTFLRDPGPAVEEAYRKLGDQRDGGTPCP